MEELKETNPQSVVIETQEEIKSVEQQSDKQQKTDNQLQEQQQQEIIQEQQQEQKENQIETPGEKEPDNQQNQEIHAIDYEDDDEDDDDEEEKETSQKLVIDIPDEEEEEEEKEEDEDEVLILDEIPQAVSEQNDIEKILPKPEDVEAIITLSDGEEDVAVNEAVLKPGKVQKRRSVGAATSANDEEHYRLKRRKINVAGAPKMPLTGGCLMFNKKWNYAKVDKYFLRLCTLHERPT